MTGAVGSNGQPQPGKPISRTRARTRQRILDAAADFVEDHGLDDLSMRRLSDEADISVRTIYNTFADKDAIITALVVQSFSVLDDAKARSTATDPIERIWETISISVEANHDVPKPIVAAVVAEATRFRSVADRWSGTDLILEDIEAAMAAGLLRREVPPSRLVQLAGTAFAYRLRQWAQGEIDDATLRAAVLYAYDICLLSVARPRARARLLEHLAALEQLVPELLLDLPGQEETR